ncbi:MAG: 4-hydroxy-tetrahydrodipicolinate reductase, partial [Muribaculaceae bacterium]|nr:4-hydroxy-tetrahydrodipicolinate reductase [Muribaculaceae bacterium]
VFLTRMMTNFPDYRPALHEVHHIHKLDHPSGTAKTLATELVAAAAPGITGWSETDCGPQSLTVTHERVGEVPGTHIVTWTSPVDRITIEHRAFSRDGFALGAVMAAEWLNDSGRKGYLTIDDMMDSMGLCLPTT